VKVEQQDLICVYSLKMGITIILDALNNFFQYIVIVLIANGRTPDGLTGRDVVLCADFA